MVAIVTAETNELKEKSDNLKDRLDLLMQKLMSNERKWEIIMMMQVNLVFLLKKPFENISRSRKNVH